MWQRFTERARRIVFFAQEEAGRLGETYVSTEHLLLGMIRENDSVAARILDRMGVSLSRIRSEIERRVTRGDGKLGTDMQLTPRAKRVIDLAYDEARLLKNNYIGTEHLLLGLVRENDGLAGRVLAKLGVELDQTRAEVAVLQENDSGQSSEGGAIPHGTSFPQKVEAKEAVAAAYVRQVLRQRNIPDAEQERAALAVRQMFNQMSDWRGKSLVSLADVTANQIRTVLDAAKALKALHQERKEVLYWNYPRTLGMIFEKPSLRTRVSFEAGMAHLGGHAIYLAAADIGLGTREPVEDVARALSRWVDVISARVFKHKTVEALATHATVPVINALSDREHPVQAFADLLTLEERKGALGNNLKVAYIGDGNNVLHALLLACARMGVNLSAACPEGYHPDPRYVELARSAASETGAAIVVNSDPAEAAQNADALYADVWSSMGQEDEQERRAVVFAPYQINAELIARAGSDAIVLHCLPAHHGEEISSDVFQQHQTVIMDQAENRMHTQKALIALILGI